MLDTPERLAERLNLEGQKTVDFFCRFTPDQLEQIIYSDGSSWSVRQVLAHLVSSEKAFGDLIVDILDGGLGAPEGFDIHQFNQGEVAGMDGENREDLLRQFEEQRELNVKRISRIHSEDLNRLGRHPYLGIVALEEIVKLLYRHNQIHQRDVRRLVSDEFGGISG